MAIPESDQSQGIVSTADASTFLTALLNKYVTPTFGIPEEWGFKKDPREVDNYILNYAQRKRELPEYVEECKEVLANWEAAKNLASQVAKDWGIPLDIEFFESVMESMRDNIDGMWNSSSVMC